jgi:hypothetical protein
MDLYRNKTGGRKAGTPNKVTTRTREAFEKLIDGNIDNLQVWLEKVAESDPKAAFEIILKLSAFVLPKLARVENHNIETSAPEKVRPEWFNEV